mmetsp:Transcript_130953/g.310570  ORF Transcript_130953/g.310570 Transcript_130953/m.310570 type:complete len:200 (+) Transcript_130953:1555-2154(+)
MEAPCAQCFRRDYQLLLDPDDGHPRSFCAGVGRGYDGIAHECSHQHRALPQHGGIPHALCDPLCIDPTERHGRFSGERSPRAWSDPRAGGSQREARPAVQENPGLGPRCHGRRTREPLHLRPANGSADRDSCGFRGGRGLFGLDTAVTADFRIFDDLCSGGARDNATICQRVLGSDQEGGISDILWGDRKGEQQGRLLR